MTEINKPKTSGRLVELPLALGDKIYWMPDYESWKAYYTSGDECIFEETVSGIAMKEDGFYVNCEEDDDTAWNKLGEYGALATLEDAQKMLEQYKKRAWMEGRDDT